MDGLSSDVVFAAGVVVVALLVLVLGSFGAYLGETKV
jgi:hypothetical protein